MGGYVEGGVDTTVLLDEHFRKASGRRETAQELGMGPEAHARLMSQQLMWQFEITFKPEFSKFSPLLQKQLETQALQADLKMNGTQFDGLMKRQSEWEGKVERGEMRESSSPVAQATIARLQPTETKLDFTQKVER